MLFYFVLTVVTVAVEAQLDLLHMGGIDLNPAHQLCQPCIFAANTLKSTNKQPSVKEAEKRTCNSILNNEMVCNGAVEVAGIYLNWTPAEKICENFRMCAVPEKDQSQKRKIRSIQGSRPDEVARKVLSALESDEFPVSMPRFAREVNYLSQLDLQKIEEFQKLIQEHSEEVNEALQQLLARFKNAIRVYIDATSPTSSRIF